MKKEADVKVSKEVEEIKFSGKTDEELKDVMGQLINQNEEHMRLISYHTTMHTKKLGAIEIISALLPREDDVEKVKGD